MVKKVIKLSLLIFILIVTWIGVYWFFNPTIYNKDFHLEYRVANSGVNFSSLRNEKIEKGRFTYSNNTYLNDKSKYKLSIHSLDFLNKKEKIIIVSDDLNTGHKNAIVTYKNQDGSFAPIGIKSKGDSIFIVQFLDIGNSNYRDKNDSIIIFEGIFINKDTFID